MKFEAVYKKYKIRLLKFTYNYTKDQFEQEELVQDIFYNIYLALKNYKGKASINTFIYSIARNTCRNFINKKIKDRKKINKLIQYFEEKFESTLFESFILSEDMKYFLSVVDKLDKDYKEIYYLSEVENLKYREISSVLDIPIGTVKSRLNRAKEKIIKLLNIKQNGGVLYEKNRNIKL